MKKIYFALMCAFIANTSNCQTLDPTFGTGGIVETPYGQYIESKVNDMLLQPDGKILVCGTTYVNTYDFMMIRYMPDGSLDPTFGSQGKAFVDFGSFNNYGLAYALQTDGKIVCAGWSETPGYSSISLARFNANGTADVSFGDSGILHLAAGQYESFGNDVLIQADGKIVVAGRGNYGSQGVDLCIARVNSNGEYDTSFGTSGVVQNVNDLSSVERPVLAQQQDGKIVVSGMGGTGSQQNYCVLRFLENGDLDPSFSEDGIQLTYIAGDYNWPGDIVVQPDGKILVAGYSGPYLGTFMSMLRYNTDGALDADFATNGIFTYSVNPDLDLLEDIVLQPDGKILTCGYTIVPNEGYDFIIMRLLENGTMDPEFGVDGMLNQVFSYQESRAVAMDIQTDGKLVVAGYSPVPEDYHTAVARYDAGIPAAIDDKMATTVEGFVFPNPVNDQLSFRYEGDGFSADVKMYDAQGALIDSCKKIGKTWTYDVKHFSPGMYFLQTTNGQGIAKYYKWMKE